ncbi:H-NS histone family protein [Pseudooceanicola sp.]|uniref:H-NS histone family protein n=1 Tax=Pseudooceanicola sp. TaxID=1914328 RepID=UPI00260D20A7|nr:H-NS histone family protein [Pseudooceanicola sp.]MDF1855645.1 H-NS histone family protein [Pseudooceanicola sp.]
MKIDLENISLDELKALRKDVETAIRNFQDRERKKALDALEEKARELGYSLSDLTGSGAKTRKVNPAKYRHSDDPNKTWSGRGRQPGWIKEILANGGNLDDYLIRK